MELSRHLLWSQGLFLTPQHLQQQDFAQQAAIAALWKTAMPFGWGVAVLKIRESSVESSVIDVVDLQAVTRDGVFLHAGIEGGIGINAVIHRSAFKDVSHARPAAVFVALARHLPDQDALARDAELKSGDLIARRYVVVDSVVKDAFDLEQPEPAVVARLNHLLQIVTVTEDANFDRQVGEYRRNFELLQIARLTPEGNRLVLDISYVPPALELAAVPHLLRDTEDLAEQFVRLIRQYSDLRRDRGLGVEVGAARDISLFFVLRSLNEHASALKQIAERRRVHPADLYYRLRQAVADLAALSKSTSYLGDSPAEDGRPARDLLLPYDHDDIGPRMAKAMSCVRELLGELGVGPAMSVELVFDGSSTWSATIAPEFFDGRLPKFFLLVESSLTTEQVQSRLNDRKIGAQSHMGDLIDRRLRGLAIDYQRYVPDHLPQRSNRYSYFEIDQKDIYWERIRQDGNVHLYCPELTAKDAVIRLVKTVSDR